LTTYWHVVPPDDPLVAENGSAVLNVAQHLTQEGNLQGRRSLLIGGTAVIPTLEDSRAWLNTARDDGPSRLRRNVMRSLRGSSRADNRTLPSTIPTEEVPDVVVLHNQHWLVHSAARTFPRATRVLYVHNRIMTGVPLPRARSILYRFDAVICVSTSIADLIRGMAPNHPEIHVSLSGAPARAVEQMDAPVFDIGFLGRLTAEKGVHLLLEAVERLQSSRGVRASVAIGGSRWFYGDDSPNAYERGLIEKAERSNLNISFRGRLQPAQVPAFLNSCRIICVPSLWSEPFSLVLAEAMASNAAVLATRVGGMPEAACNGALFVDPTARNVAEGLAALMEDEIFRESIADQGRQRAAILTWSACASRLFAAVDSVRAGG
jgi:glycosyltransferase involved in cell wall biosynthesis